MTTTITTPARTRFTLAAVLGTVALAAFTGCATTAAPSTAQTGAAAAAAAAETVTLADAWVKAADDGMTGAFGTLENAGDADVTLVSVETDAAGMVELHETVENDSGEMAMREKDGGFTIPAGGTLELAPGGDHIMLMGLAAPIVAGDELAFTLTFSDDSTLEVTAPAKDFSGANENYEGGDEE